MRPLIAASVDGIEQAVVIPVLAERDSLFKTLAGVAKNPSRDLQRTIVICVVNNYRPPLSGEPEIVNNQQTIRLLHTLVFGRSVSMTLPDEIRGDVQRIADSGLRLAFIDASSPGLEIPDRDGGVGTARKIGMDAALQIIDSRAVNVGVICCLDADTQVEENYLCAILMHFARTGHPAAVSAYAHQKPDNLGLLAAISSYEIFLRSYVIGLSYAGSPYAFHSIGSTMSCSAEGYAAVRGMNRRQAAEDFHFLNKLAKIGKVGVISETTVFPSPRPSMRVPFGTGQRVTRFLTGKTDEYRLYDPRIFEILREWLVLMEDTPDRNPESILADAGLINRNLEEYLRMNRFASDWVAIKKNCRNAGQLQRRFHVWFDGLKTLRLIHHLSGSNFPLIPMFDGLTDFIPLPGRPHSRTSSLGSVPEPEEQFRILESLRFEYPYS